MIKQNELTPSPRSRHKKKHVGRGLGSGHGRYSGRGQKGQNSRSGGGVRLGFEGGQLPLIRRLPRKRGFHNPFRTEYAIVNVGRLDIFQPDSSVTPQLLAEARVVKSARKPIKILGSGEINHPLTVKAHKFSAVARKKIEIAGGKTEEIGSASEAS